MARVIINGEELVDNKTRNWLDRTGFTGASAPDVVGPWYSSSDTAIRTVAVAPSITFIWNQGSRSGAGTIKAWVPASTKKVKVLKYQMTTDTAGTKVAFQENTGTIGTPTWTSRETWFFPQYGSVAMAHPEQFFGPAGDGAGATARLEVLSGAGTHEGAMHGFEA